MPSRRPELKRADIVVSVRRHITRRNFETCDTSYVAVVFVFVPAVFSKALVIYHLTAYVRQNSDVCRVYRPRFDDTSRTSMTASTNTAHDDRWVLYYFHRRRYTFVVGTTERSSIAKVPRISSPAQRPKHLSQTCREEQQQQ